MKKEYWINGTQLASAREAMAAHRDGIDVVAWYHDSHTITIKGAAQKKTSRLDENTAHCKHIAKTVDAYANGDVRKCPECGETINREWDDVGDVFRCPECGHVDDVDGFEEQTIWDYLNDVYDVEFRVDSSKELRSVQIMVACGGPNIYLDTASRDVELYWWTESARRPLSYEAVQALDDWAEEYWGCL